MIATVACVTLFGMLNVVAIAELKTLDTLRISHPPHPDITLVAIDNKSLEQIGRWPWNRSIHADLLNKLVMVNPQAVAFDVNFAETQDVKNDTALAKAVAHAKFPVVLPVQALYVKGSVAPEKALVPIEMLRSKANVQLGHVNISLAADGAARLLPQTIAIARDSYTPFGAVIAGLLHAPYPTSGMYAIAFAGPAGTFPTYSVSDVLAGKIARDVLSDKIILIGATVSDLHDTVSVPLGNGVMAGVEWNANVIDNVLLGRYLFVVPRIWSILIWIVLSFLLFWFFSRVQLRMGIIFAALGIIVSIAASAALLRVGVEYPFFMNAVAVTAVFAAHGLYRWYAVEAEKRKLKKTFQNYFSPQIMSAIIRDPACLHLGGVKREVTIFFSDIRSFTTITESTEPEVLSRMLHEYFTEMTEEVLATDGVVDKFIGDAVMAFWGAPIAQEDHAERAVRAAIGMFARLKKLQEKWKAEGLAFVDIGVGIHTGLATVGNMGSAKRFDYTVIGDAVNAASRLESLNKEHKTHIIISEETKKHLPADIVCRNLGDVMVKGKTKALTIYEVVLEGVPPLK